MAEYQGQHATRVDEYGNPVSHGTGMQGGYGATGMGGHGVTGVGAGGGQFQPVREEHKTGGILHRSGSSSSSSSEDDGEGGRRKKGIKEKIKEKLPGGHKNEAEQNYGAGYGQGHTGMAGTNTGGYGQGHTGMAGTNTGGYGQGHTGMAGAHGTTEGTGEKKGLMDKIKEKLPGQH